jgi:hypothetical protein
MQLQWLVRNIYRKAVSSQEKTLAEKCLMTEMLDSAYAGLQA